MTGLAADLIHALRVYRKTPASSGLAVVILAIAMAIVTAFLSLWSDLSLRDARGFERGAELISIGQTDGRRVLPISYALLERINDEVTAIDSTAGILLTTQYFDRDGQRAPLSIEVVTKGYFIDMGPVVQLGRGFDEADHDAQAEPVVVISDTFWRQEFAARPDVLGRTLRMYGPNFVIRTPDGEARAAEKWQDYRIVGVMGPALPGTFAAGAAAWAPYEQSAPVFFGDAGPNFVNMAQLRAIARLTPGANPNAARSELEGRYADVGMELGRIPETRMDALAGLVLDLNARRAALQQIRLFLAGSILLALVAACNVSLFLLSRAPGRQRELAIRMSVGAPLRRLARQLATEAGLIVIGAAAIGVLLSLWLAVVIRELPFLQGAAWSEVIRLDWRILLLVIAFAAILTLLVSLAPVMSLRRLQIGAGTRAVSARAGIAQQLAGAAQITVAGVIGAAALAFVWHLVALGRIDPGFAAPSVYIVALEPPEFDLGNRASEEALVLERDRRREVIAAIPAVEAVGFGTAGPGFDRSLMSTQLAPPDSPDDRFIVRINTADPGYFDLLGVGLVDGRAFEESDRNEVVINATLARRLWGRTDVAGESIPFGGPPGSNAARREVIGVIADVAFGHPENDIEPMMFFHGSGALPLEWVLIRSSAGVADLRSELQAPIDSGELDITITSIDRVEQSWGTVLAADRARTWLTVASAIFVVVLAAFGYYGTQRFLVAAGRREYAILAALGAGPRALGRLVFGRGLLQGVPGLVLGSLLGFIVVAWMKDGFVAATVSPTAITVVVLAGLLALLLCATAGPARQARSTDPGPLLKEE